MAEETKDVLFRRSAFGGFNRRDVIRFIDTLQRGQTAQPQEDTDELHAQLDKAQAALSDAMRQIDALQEQNTQLRAMLKVEKTTNELLDEKRRGALPEEAFSAAEESVDAFDAGKGSLSMRDVDEMVQKYFG